MPVVTDYTAILSGASWNGIEVAGTPVFVTYSFPTVSPDTHQDIGGLPVNTFATFTTDQQAQARAALKEWSDASGIIFIEVAAGTGQIQFAGYDFTGFTFAGGFAFHPFGNWDGSSYPYFFDDAPFQNSGDVFMNSAFLSSGLYAYETLLHEIGHALGFKHPTEVLNNYPIFGFNHDQVLAIDDPLATIMAQVGGGTGHLTSLDEAAVAFVYGLAGSMTTHVSFFNFDTGTQTLTQIGFATDDVLRGIDIADIIDANDGNDIVLSLGGNDAVTAGAGNDTVFGGSGNDTLDGGEGDDQLLGQDGNDVLRPGTGYGFVDGGNDRDALTFTDFSGAPGNYLITRLDLNYAVSLFGEIGLGVYNIEDVTGSQSDDQITGDVNDNDLIGWYGRDTIVGGAGNDVILGYNGDITRGEGLSIGSSGPMDTSNDSLVGDAGADFIAGGAGNDTLDGGSDNDTVLGDDGADTVSGGDGDGDDEVYGDQLDALAPGFGNDLITGGLGSDRLYGGGGADTFVRDANDASSAQADVIVDFVTTAVNGSVHDVVDLRYENAPASFTVLNDWLLRTSGSGNTGPGDALLLSVWNSNQQTVRFEGVLAVNFAGTLITSLSASDFIFDTALASRVITGTSGDDAIFGGLGGDSLSGSGGADLIAGDAGNDTLRGGAGTDLLDGGAGADVLDGGSEIDAVYYMRRVDFALVGGVATAVGSTQVGDEAIGDSFASIELVRGSKFGDTITIDTSVQQLFGFGGDDRLTGSGGANTMLGGDGNDTIIGGGGADELFGNAGDDSINGSASSVRVYQWGGAGNDVLVGGSGDDVLNGEDNNDTINGGNGRDYIYGGTGSDVVNGEGGDDHFYDADGMSGDSYAGGTGTNVLHYQTGGTFDFNAVGADTFDTDGNWVLFDAGAVNATGISGQINRILGSAFNDTLTGGNGNDWLRGGDGNDTLNGGAGNDRLVGGNGADWFEAGAGSDTYQGEAGADTFVFRDVSGYVNTPTVLDFSSAQGDKIALEAADFAAQSVGAFAAGQFYTANNYWAAPPSISGTAAAVIYDTSNGFLYYDGNGSAAGGVTLAGILKANPTLTAADIILI